MTIPGAFTVPLALLSLLSLGANAAASDNWSAAKTDGGTDRQAACTLVSAHQQMDDTQGQTAVWLEISPTALTVKTGSDIDAEFKDLTLQVDDQDAIPSDALDGNTNVVFSKAADTITQQFIQGVKVRVRLRFWPTWPSQGLRTVDFSLIGFTQAYQGLEGCAKQPATPPEPDTKAEQSNKAGQDNPPQPQEGQPKEVKDETGDKI